MGYKTSFSPDIAQALQATSTDASSRGSPKHKTFSWDDSISSFYHYFLFPLPLTIALCLSIIYLFGGSEDWSVIAPVIVGGWGGGIDRSSVLFVLRSEAHCWHWTDDWKVAEDADWFCVNVIHFVDNVMMNFILTRINGWADAATNSLISQYLCSHRTAARK